ncbi:major facilitator superfamily domain-containing protein 10 [Suncus etruscus]|uniref:major facilitator superfamily domain-containing protein 10 n=1 Tax=Suncus etruscus TaxID=109475 RepID=UPI0021104E3E|nr:major facilitator superfamily domain-containing protein 10 [Suncus etruscus]
MTVPVLCPRRVRSAYSAVNLDFTGSDVKVHPRQPILSVPGLRRKIKAEGERGGVGVQLEPKPASSPPIRCGGRQRPSIGPHGALARRGEARGRAASAVGRAARGGDGGWRAGRFGARAVGRAAGAGPSGADARPPRPPAVPQGSATGGAMERGCSPRPPIRPPPPSERRVLAAVFLGLLLDLLAFTLLLPLLPRLLEGHGRAHDPLYGSWHRAVDWLAAAIGMPAQGRYHTVLFGGLVGSVFSGLQFLCAPLTGAVSDRLGRRPVMLLSLTGVAASYGVWVSSRSFAAFLASRVLGGISKGNVSLSTAIVADLGAPAARSRGMVAIGVAFSLGFTLGPMLGASLPAHLAPWLALLLAASDLLFVFCFLPETLPPEKRAPSMALGFQAAADLLSPLALLRFSAVARGQDSTVAQELSSLRRLGLVYFLYLFLFSGLEFTLSFLAHERFQFSSLQQGKMFFFIGLTMAVVQGTYTRGICPGREPRAISQAILLLVPAFLLIGWGRSLPALGLGLLLYSFAAAVVVPCLSSVVASYGSPAQKGTVMGTLRSLGALARTLGPMVAASVYWLAGDRACFTVWSGLFLLPFLILRNLRPSTPAKAQ